MKNLIHFTLAASLAAGAAAHVHQNQHDHLHARKHAAHAHLEQRDADPAVKWVVGPTEVVYELDGKIVNPAEAKAGISKGDFVVVGETKPSFTPPPPPPPATTSAAVPGDQFFESKQSTTAVPTSTSVAPPPPPPSSSAAAPPPSSSPPASSGSGATGLDADFPSGTIKCNVFPSAYGAVPLNWLDMNGWSGLQFVPEYTPGAASISDIVGGIAGQDCSPGAMCSFACPAGYQKAQWPSSQGNTGQSIGGLYCNPDGFLELTNSAYKTLCIPGKGGVSIQNDLTEDVCTCRTDYPGSEDMVIPAIAPAGGSVQVCNPDQSTYYNWDGKDTSAQYYVNNKGLSVEDACVWNSPSQPGSAGNWSPVILGVGWSNGVTYISIFQNLPTSDAQLDFNIEIKGGNTECSFINGVWTGGATGCTTGLADGESAIVRYF